MKEKNLAVELLKKLISEQVQVYKRTNVVKSQKFSEIIQAAMNRYLNGMLTNEQVIEELLNLAKQIAGDGEGCTRLFEVTCNGAATKEDAKIISKSVVCSTLTKAAVFGKDANWGRILCAMGYSGVTFDPEKVDIVLESEEGSLAIVKDGIATDYSEEKATQILSANPVKAILDIHAGEEKATAWGCDLTYEYVTINADYRS